MCDKIHILVLSEKIPKRPSYTKELSLSCILAESYFLLVFNWRLFYRIYLLMFFTCFIHILRNSFLILSPQLFNKLFGLNSSVSKSIYISRPQRIQARQPGQFITLDAAGRQAEHVGKPAATKGGPGGVRRSRGEGSEGRRDRPEVYRGRHLKCAPIANLAVRDSSQAEESAGKMSYSRSVTLLLLLAVLARGKSTTTATATCEVVTFTSPTRDPIPRIVRASPPWNAFFVFLRGLLLHRREHFLLVHGLLTGCDIMLGPMGLSLTKRHMLRSACVT